MRTKPFNLEEAKNGAKLVTRDGRSARIICFDAKHAFPIVALISENNKNEHVKKYLINGYYYSNDCKSDVDLLILDENEPIYILYETTDELMVEIKKHGAWLKEIGTTRYVQIKGFYEESDKLFIELYEEADYHSSLLLSKYVWADDNTPCGKLKE